ncbi:MAG: hypothetical protein II788_04330 [Acholeplasmatales bacterium]|nr:hypothetical protein [Acholeplasmatales bacterium]
MRKASNILFILSVIVSLAVSIILLIGDDPAYRVLAIVNLVFVVLGLILRPLLQANDHPVVAAVITLVFVSSGGFGLISAILLFVSAGQSRRSEINAINRARAKNTIMHEAGLSTFGKPVAILYREKFDEIVKNYKNGTILKEYAINQLEGLKKKIDEKRMAAIASLNKFENNPYPSNLDLKLELKKNIRELESLSLEINVFLVDNQ